MTTFDKTKFKYDGLFLMYDNAFVARFKRGGMSHFKSFLIENFSVEEYFQSMEKSTPMQALEAKGYVSTNLKTLLKSNGFPPTQDGKHEYLNSLSRA